MGGEVVDRLDRRERHPGRRCRQVAVVPFRGGCRLAPFAAGEDPDLHIPPAPGRVDLGGIALELDIPGRDGERSRRRQAIRPGSCDPFGLRLARPADRLVADLPATALRQESLGDGEGVLPASKQTSRVACRVRYPWRPRSDPRSSPRGRRSGRQNTPARSRPRPVRSSPFWTRCPCAAPPRHTDRFGRRPFFSGIRRGIGGSTPTSSSRNPGRVPA